MTLPPKDHPIWKVLQGAISLVGLLILVIHGVDGGHTTGLDASDGAGAVGVGLAGRLAWLFFRTKA